MSNSVDIASIVDPTVKALFQEIDVDRNGLVDFKEIKTAMENKKLLDQRLNLLQKRMLVLGCISIAVIVGLLFAVVYLAKDTQVKSGALTDMDGVPLKVKNADVRNSDDGTMVDAESGNDLKVATKTYFYSVFDIVRDVPKENVVDIQNVVFRDKELNVTMSLDVQGVYRHWSEDAVYACLLTASSIEALVVSVPYDENAEPAMTSIARKDCETGVWYESVGRDLFFHLKKQSFSVPLAASAAKKAQNMGKQIAAIAQRFVLCATLPYKCADFYTINAEKPCKLKSLGESLDNSHCSAAVCCREQTDEERLDQWYENSSNFVRNHT